MAVHPACPGLKVEVVVNQQPLQEYDDDGDPELQKVSKYIESVSDMNFGVRYTIKAGFHGSHGLLVDLRVDGKSMSQVVPKNNHFKKKDFTRLILGADFFDRTSRYEQKFRFSELRIGESIMKITPELLQQLRSTGKIHVHFYYVKNIRDTYRAGGQSQKDFLHFGTLPEKGMKGHSISHHGRLDAPEKKALRNSSTFDYVDPEKRPFVTFEFKYRSLEMLKALYIIPRSPCPIPLEDRPTEELTPTELKELCDQLLKEKERMRQVVKQEPKATIKRERSMADGTAKQSDDVEFVEERSAKRQRLPANDDEIICLD